ncbi:Hypothetical predicted protein [Cloeon dipterum]|uniref:CRAL-TRIO domain-containing protein n=1 Tax=Cloeon dipterum TaxID=197152 RepID=A0A8S1C1Z6_9INSE|nr:Hypothetical predicted protein [Cloeon dipterum]
MLTKEPMPVVQLGHSTLTIDRHDLTPELLEVARTELRENPDVVAKAVEELRDLLKADKELNVPWENDEYLIMFLRPCKFYAESAYQQVKRYYQFKVKHSKVYAGLVPSKEKNIFEQDILTVLPNRDNKGRRILVMELGKRWKHNECSLDEVFKGCVLFVEAALMEPCSQVAGSVVIFDMDGLSLQQVCQFTPPFAKRIVDWLQDSIPMRVKGVHIVNQPYIFNMVFALFKPFLREKLKNRIFFHGKDRASLQKHINKEALLPCYKGECDAQRLTGMDWYNLLSQLDKEYQAVNSYGYNNNNPDKIEG